MQPNKRSSASKFWFWRFRKRYGLKATKLIGNATFDEIIATKMSLTGSSHYKSHYKTEMISSMIAIGMRTRRMLS